MDPSLGMYFFQWEPLAFFRLNIFLMYIEKRNIPVIFKIHLHHVFLNQARFIILT